MQYRHIDDSLFMISLRNPRFDETTKEVGAAIQFR
jgi:hypothetical protein